MESDIKKSILLAEDEHLLANLLKQRLEKEAFKVSHAKDGEEALKMILEIKPDLMLLDVILPKMSGFEVMEKINKTPELAALNVPIVVISNLGQEGDVKKAQSFGAVGYFIKSQLSFEDLISQIKSFFGILEDENLKAAEEVSAQTPQYS